MAKVYFNNMSSPDMLVLSQNLLKANSIAESSLLADKLAYDEMTLELGSNEISICLKTSDGNLLTDPDGETLWMCKSDADYGGCKYGEPVFLCDDNEVLVSKMYITNVYRTGKYKYTLSAVSPVGILDKVQHHGGIYTGQTFKTVLDSILGNRFSYSIADDVKNTAVYGWLPYDTARNNLHQLIFAYGVNIARDDNGDMNFIYPSINIESASILKSKTFMGGSVSYSSPSSDVVLTEHSYFQSSIDKQVTLYDNTDGSGAATNFEVKFSNPCYNLLASDSLTISSSGPNYAIVNGTGKLTGYEYSHSTRLISKNAAIGTFDLQKTTKVDKCYMVNALNSENVARRVLSFYNNSSSVSTDIVASGHMAGDLVQFTNPFGNIQQGFISKIDISLTSILRAKLNILSGYVPSGAGNNYTHSTILTGSGTWTVPNGISQIRVVLIGGGAGGQSGTAGATGTYPYDPWSNANDNGGKGGHAGEGGEGGVGGNGGLIYVTTISVSSGRSFSYSCGMGGDGGVFDADDHVDGAEGTNTSFGSFSSALGAHSNNGIINMLTNTVYAYNGNDGINGSDGDAGENWGEGAVSKAVSINYTDPDTKITTAYNAGATGVLLSAEWLGSTYYAWGGKGGGAAVGANGADGGVGYTDIALSGAQRVYGGSGGNGAIPIAGRNGTAYGCGGSGGHGGGGGGAGGQVWWNPDWSGKWRKWGGEPGVGGSGSDGGRGGDGCVIIYY